VSAEDIATAATAEIIAATAIEIETEIAPTSAESLPQKPQLPLLQQRRQLNLAQSNNSHPKWAGVFKIPALFY
jgi:hypothetical protein